MTRITGTLHEHRYTFMIISRSVIFRMMFQTKVVHQIKPLVLCSISFFFFFFENRTVYEIMWKNIVEADRPQMTI
jgi:hypothetical protein